MDKETKRKIWNTLGYVIFFGAIIAYINEYLNPHRFHLIMLGLLVFVSFRTYVNNNENSKDKTPFIILLGVILILANFTWQGIIKDVQKEKVCKAVASLKDVELGVFTAQTEQNMSLVNFMKDAHNDFSRYHGTGILEHNATEILNSEIEELTDKEFIPSSKQPLGIRWKNQQLEKILHYCED